MIDLDWGDLIFDPIRKLKNMEPLQLNDSCSFLWEVPNECIAEFYEME